MKTLTTKGGKAPMKDVPEKNIVIKSIKVAD
jgi:hypothetical protein